ncbi:prolyl oligopeptidase family serine peptidase [Xinfangfangia sp. CPCC 101601]|uniref:Prolyl oligopeptidase family serine peptidase n=1 Tax=Pseudogemmobacter lacusdianii TaxID=3069608 RepID=A0ABU0VX46_9RHOB|nr:prolyl oligopeptidase family serine peptidase [Xinfangfangia sp. CPCC 101601]MDQ2066327.1 prolyl oligopeptidase family serine peptidase [Xinfangfangia sp. CPCC 101601]
MTDLAKLWSELPQMTNIHASGDGKWAFWCWAGLSETENVWCVPLDGSAPPQQLTQGTDHYQIRDVSSNGNQLILAQSRFGSDQDQLLLLDRRLNHLQPLTPAQDRHYLTGGSFTRDETGIIFAADFDYETDEVTQGCCIWWQDIRTGTRSCLGRSDGPLGVGPKFSPSRELILWHRHDRAPGGSQLWVMTAAGAGHSEVLNLGPTNNARGTWIDDDRIAVVADVEGQDRLGILTLSSGEMEWIAAEPALFPHDCLAGTGAAFLCIHHEQSHTRAALVQGRSIAPLPNRSGRRSLLPHAALPNGGWLAEAYDADAPHELVAVAADGSCRVIARAPNPAAHAGIAPEDFRWTAADSRPMQGWLYRPKGTPRGLIGYIHGGPTWHSEDWMNPKIQFWLASGFAVLDPNYRGSTGFGFAHREAVKDDGWGGREQTDIRAGLEAARATGIPGPVALAGNSYGGFSSWYAITRFADLVTAAIPMCGMYRLDIDYHATEMPHGKAYSEEMMGGTPEELPEKYDNASPGRFIEDIRGHVMIVHGLADTNVGPENTHVAVRELTEAGIPHEVLLYDNEGHGVFRRSNVEDYLRRSEDFLSKAFAAGRRDQARGG